ncbi:YgjV family protein [Vibrio hippocampi]|uniref:YgjV family protein n=1 Tax=Vibrio hippocampi TaxID=654686 RepID=A0ABM8ZM82_9VIBR|nr:YgjV family protein [Vibrio hippocampi]CAH0529645.1 hypothetical protein VHP8226_03400 [Vibrio hippocampi]
MNIETVELLGYAASIIVAISFTMKQIVRLRVINCIGCVLFTLYGFAIDSVPVIITNGFIAGVNVFYLLRTYKQQKRRG